MNNVEHENKCYMYVVYDKLARRSSDIYFESNDAVAKRQAVRYIMNLENVDESEFELRNIGVYDRVSCVIEHKEVVILSLEEYFSAYKNRLKID